MASLHTHKHTYKYIHLCAERPVNEKINNNKLVKHGRENAHLARIKLEDTQMDSEKNSHNLL